jgi:hypothetical protein
MSYLIILVSMAKLYFVTKIVLDQLCDFFISCDREKHLKYQTEGREVAKFLRSLEQFIRTVIGQYNF